MIVVTVLIFTILSTKTYEVSAAVTCGQVAASISSCINYAKGPGGIPPVPCCNGIRGMWNRAVTTPDRQIACRCLKSIATNIPNVNMATVGTLPAQCHVDIPYKISLSTNCDT